MGSIAQRRIGLKTAWKVQGDRRESFGWISAVSMLYKTGIVSRDIALGMLHARVTKEDFDEFRRARGEPLQ